MKRYLTQFSHTNILMKRILVPTDFSKHAEYALKVAAQIAKKNNGEIFILHMLELPHEGNDAFSHGHDIPEIMYFKKRAEEKLDDLCDAPYLSGIDVSEIIKIEGTGEDKKATIFFPQEGSKTLLLRFAKLDVID